MLGKKEIADMDVESMKRATVHLAMQNSVTYAAPNA
jgi:hypothetical protein